MSGAAAGRRLVFGLDGGGTNTRLRIADGTNAAIWEGKGEGINPNALPPAQVAERLAALFGEAFKATSLTSADFSAGCMGVAGADRGPERAEFTELARIRLGFGCPLLVTSDPDIALVGALERVDGYLLIAGTGSIAIARLADGTRYRAGGLGHYLSDEGSAFFIGFQAIRRALRSAEGRDLPTVMMGPLLSHFGLGSPQEFVPFIYRRFDKAAVAGAAALVERFRAQGDPLAAAIMAEARDELVRLVGSVRESAREGLDTPAIALTGGLFEHNAWLKGAVRAALSENFPELAIVEPRRDGAYGACMLALELVGSD
jgi:N-acetylglucosamine kinase-like BadF-type ATPase